MSKLLTKKESILAFTLVEILIVIVIIGILVATILPKIIGVKERAEDVARMADLRNISLALQLYMQDHGEYPDGCGSLDKNLKTDSKFKGYMTEIPSDPVKNNQIENRTPGEYFYCGIPKYGIPNNGYFLEFKALSTRSANLFPLLWLEEGKGHTWEVIQGAFEKCPEGIKEGPENTSKCQTTFNKFRYLILSP